MAIKLWMPSAFDRHKRLGEIIGRMVIEYGEMEWDLCLLVGHVIGNSDTALKAMYRSRGETQRIDVADALVRNRLEMGRLRTTYEETLAHMRTCLKLRNQYAHANWVDVPSEGLCYINFECAASSDKEADVNALPRFCLDLEIVEDQQRFFVEVLQNLRYLSMEVQAKNGSVAHKGFHYVKPISKPRKARELD
jgi:hypothetical protein